MSQQSYHISHRPSKDCPLHDMEQGGCMPDFYDHPEWYVFARNASYKESIKAIMAVRNRPSKLVTVYRGGIKPELNDGDWISLSRKYAIDHAIDLDGPGQDGKVYAFKVKASDVWTDGNDVNEFGYFGPRITGDLVEQTTTANVASVVMSLHHRAVPRDLRDLKRGLEEVERFLDECNLCDEGEP